ncbi:hypothetical protein C8Q80DRAFT_130904 [Daedaleopsis nitida]|nr:hypothetical protein C8Q80DRAFT_130904 [Daedaleopsis nitida]
MRQVIMAQSAMRGYSNPPSIRRRRCLGPLPPSSVWHRVTGAAWCSVHRSGPRTAVNLNSRSHFTLSDTELAAEAFGSSLLRPQGLEPGAKPKGLICISA